MPIVDKLREEFSFFRGNYLVFAVSMSQKGEKNERIVTDEKSTQASQLTDCSEKSSIKKKGFCVFDIHIS